VFVVVLTVCVAGQLVFEEAELALRLGPSYLDYKRRTPFLLPRLGERRVGTHGA
jgi:protein-S-isoprenylcysteine O-methyltransferase Ste14